MKWNIINMHQNSVEQKLINNNGWHFAPYHFSLMYGFQQEPLYWYLQTLISLGVFHVQLLGFSDKIIAYQPGLFCVVMLLARWMQPQHRWEKLNEKIRKSKTLSMQHTFCRFLFWHCMTSIAKLDWSGNAIVASSISSLTVYHLHFQKYFFSLVIGVKLNMAVCGYRVGRMNHLKPEVVTKR